MVYTKLSTGNYSGSLLPVVVDVAQPKSRSLDKPSILVKGHTIRLPACALGYRHCMIDTVRQDRCEGG